MTALQGRVVAVTGAGRGIGLVITETLVERGAHVLANYARSHEELDRLLHQHPGSITLVRGDVGEEGTARALVAAARARGGLHAVVHNAAVSRDRPLVRMSVEDWDDVQRVNLRGAFLVTKHALRLMMRQKYGRFLYVSSVSGVMGNAGQANYAASKAGLDGLARAVAQEYASYGVRTVVLAPGLVDCGLGAAAPPEVQSQKLSRLLLGAVTAREVAGTAAFLVGPDADHISATTVRLDGGVRF